MRTDGRYALLTASAVAAWQRASRHSRGRPRGFSTRLFVLDHVAVHAFGNGIYRNQADHADEHDVAAEEPRPIAACRQQPRCNDWRQAAREDSRRLIDERDAAVTHARWFLPRAARLARCTFQSRVLCYGRNC